MERRVIVDVDSMEFSFATGDYSLGPLSFDIERGEVVSIVGINAAGKSTALRLIAGEILPDSGNVTYPDLCNGQKNWSCIKRGIRKLNAFDNRFGYFGETVVESLEASACKFGISGHEAQTTARRITDLLGLSRFADWQWEDLSDGFKHRAAIGRILVTDPALILLDEPLANLDLITRQSITKALREYVEADANPPGIVITSQDVHTVERLSDKIIVIDDGNEVYAGRLSDIASKFEWHVFEIGISGDIDEFIKILESLEPTRVLKNLSSISVYFSQNMDGRDLLERILSWGFHLTFFHDISNSSQPLLELSGDARDAGK